LDGESISWHPGFYDMIQEEFGEYGDALSSEHPPLSLASG
jgi:hypothetical protein